jgi:hypothetical protein
MPQKTGEPENGTEFFFSNVMVKVVQTPVLFTISSECPRNNYNGAFLVLIFEKLTRKRTYARSIN